MATNNSANETFTNNSDGFTLAGGTTSRSLTATGSNITLTGSGSSTFTFPAASDTLVGQTSTDTLSNKTIDTASSNTLKVNGNTLAATAGTATVTVPNSTGTLALTSSNITGTAAGITGKTTPSGALVGDTDTQTLTNKTLTQPKADFIDDSNGAKEIELVATASSANWVKLSNTVTGSGVTIGVNGTGTNENLTLAAMGTGTVQVGGSQVTTAANAQTLTNKTLTSPKVNQVNDTNGKTSLLIDATASAVNYLEVANGATGNAPALVANGTDTNVSLFLRGKGSGSTIIADGNSNTIFQGTGVTSAVNSVNITNSATTVAPSIAAQGTDTNIDINLAPKGSGAVYVSASNGLELLGSSSGPTTPATGIGKIVMAGTGAVRPKFINSSGTLETFLTDASVVRQNNTTNSGSIAGVRVETGWGFVTGTGSFTFANKSITFATAFSAAPIVVVSCIGYKDTTDPTSISDFGNWEVPNANGTAISTTGFNIYIGTIDGTNIVNGRRIGFTWIAIGA